MPSATTMPPMTVKITVQLPSRFWSRPIKPPKTTRIAIRGIMALMPSTAPRLVSSVESVSQALKQASLAEEPKKVMMQSRAMVRVMHSDSAALLVDIMGKNRLWTVPSRIRPKPRMEIPQRI